MSEKSKKAHKTYRQILTSYKYHFSTISVPYQLLICHRKHEYRSIITYRFFLNFPIISCHHSKADKPGPTPMFFWNICSRPMKRTSNDFSYPLDCSRDWFAQTAQMGPITVQLRTIFHQRLASTKLH